MAKASISIGVDDATGQPENGPEGPYITDEDDGTRPRKVKRGVPAEHDKARDSRARDAKGVRSQRKRLARP